MPYRSIQHKKSHALHIQTKLVCRQDITDVLSAATQQIPCLQGRNICLVCRDKSMGFPSPSCNSTPEEHTLGRAHAHTHAGAHALTHTFTVLVRASPLGLDMTSAPRCCLDAKLRQRGMPKRSIHLQKSQALPKDTKAHAHESARPHTLGRAHAHTHARTQAHPPPEA